MSDQKPVLVYYNCKENNKYAKIYFERDNLSILDIYATKCPKCGNPLRICADRNMEIAINLGWKLDVEIIGINSGKFIENKVCRDVKLNPGADRKYFTLKRALIMSDNIDIDVVEYRNIKLKLEKKKIMIRFQNINF